MTDYEPDAIPIHVVYPRRRLLSATVRSFVEFLQARFQPTPYWDKAVAEHGRSHNGSKTRRSKAINLALQGAGVHGAFTWGVLDRVLEHGGIRVKPSARPVRGR